MQAEVVELMLLMLIDGLQIRSELTLDGTAETPVNAIFDTLALAFRAAKDALRAASLPG